jgi:NRAMP (natural resistance-associated macrophage protein)-like metal ion transporter
MNRIKKFWRTLGPGLITGSADNDPAGITTYSLAGAQYGYGTLWIAFFILPFMIAIQEMSARIGALSGCGLAGNMKRHYSKTLLGMVAIMIILANIFNIGANVYGMASSLNLLVPIPVEILAVAVSAFTIFLIIRLRYEHIVSVFKWLAISLSAYFFALVIVNPSWWEILKSSVIPSVEFSKEFLVMGFAIIGTTISPYLYFWQSTEEAQDIRMQNPRIRVCKFRPISGDSLSKLETDTKVGMTFSNLISIFIIALAANTLFKAGITEVQTIDQVAQALQPIAGKYAYLLFTLGIFSAGFLSIPVLAGSATYVLSEMFEFKGSLDDTFSKAKPFYLVVIIAIAAGLAIPLIGITPVKALYYSAIFNGLITPPLILLVVHMASNPAIVGGEKTKRSYNILGHVSFLIMSIGAAFVLFY